MCPRRYRPTTCRLLLVLAIALTLLACGTSPPPSSVRIDVTTKPGTDLAFDPARVVAPAYERVSLVFSNASTLAHNLVLLTPLEVATREIIQPGESDVVQFDAPAPGTYRFVCSIHEDMSGTLETR